MGRQRKQDYILPERVYRHGRRFRMRVYERGHPKWHTFKARTIESLYKEYARYIKRKSVLTINDLMDRYAAEVIPKKPSGATQVSDKAALRQLRPVFGTFKVDALRRQHVVAYLDNRGELAPVRANRERALLSHIMTKATHWGILDDNPILHLQYRCPEPPRTRYVTDRELFTAMRRAPAPIRYAMRLVYLTGLRRKDILGMTWGDVSDDGLDVTISKSRRAGAAPKRLLFEWSPKLERVFNRLRYHRWQLEDSEPVIRMSESVFAKAWTALQNDLVALGIERFGMKDIRAKYATDSLARGLDATERLAHSSAATTRRHYTQRLPTRVKT